MLRKYIIYVNLILVLIHSGCLAKKKSPVSGHRSASKSVQWRRFFLLEIFFLPTSEMLYMHTVIATRPNFPSLTNRANVHTPMWKSRLKTQDGRIPITPAIEHRFIATKMLTCGSEARNQRLFVGPLPWSQTGRLSEPINEGPDQWENRSMSELINKRTDQWVNRSIREPINEWTDQWVNWSMSELINEWTDR